MCAAPLPSRTPRTPADTVLAVTGGTGFIGTAVLRQALARGHGVRALLRPGRTPPFSAARLEWVEGDMRDPATWLRLLPDTHALVHLAAAGVATIDSALDAVHVNLPSLAHLLRGCADAGVRRVVLAGSCFEYGFTGERIGARGLKEDDPLAPANAYAAAKAAATLLTGPLARDLGLEAFVLRPFHVYGPGESETRLIPAVIKMALSGEPIRVTAARQVRDFVFLDDVARGFVTAANARWPRHPGEFEPAVLNLGTGRPTPIWQVVEEIATLCRRRPEEIEYGAVALRPHEMWRLVADPAAASEVLGWNARVSLTEGLKALVEASAVRSRPRTARARPRRRRVQG